MTTDEPAVAVNASGVYHAAALSCGRSSWSSENVVLHSRGESSKHAGSYEAAPRGGPHRMRLMTVHAGTQSAWIRNHSTVLERPSSKPIVGSQPSCCRANVMSG